jgi:ABC-type dipeptide/oligopeptide/nickel transport system permease component
VVETILVFRAWAAFVTNISKRDYPVIMGTILVFAALLVIANTMVDVLRLA